MTIIAIEGNIGAGKSTFIQKLSTEFSKLGIQHETLSEPVSEWQSFGPMQQNLLQEMYHDPRAKSFYFQLVALLTKCEQVAECKEKLLLVERTILAQLKVFLPLLKENNSITDLESEICSRFMVHLSKLEHHSPSLIIYLQIDPSLAKERVLKRGRSEETEISLDYLQKVNEKYDNWLLTSNNVLILDARETENEYEIARTIIERLKL